MRLRDALVAALRLVAGLALVFGVPAALVVGVGWPLPREVPSLDAIGEALLREGVSAEVMMKTLAVIVWVAWAQLTVALVVETVAAIKGRQAGRAPLLPGIQLLAGQIVGSTALIVSVLGPLRSTVTDAAQPIDVARLELVAGRQTLALPSAAASEPTAVNDADHGGYVVQRGDSYWAIAVRQLGDGMRWREIRDPNVGRTMSDGHTISADDTLLRPGWRLELPEPARADRTASSPDVVEATYVVQPGDHFWSIAADHLVDEFGRAPTAAEIVPRWRALIDANEDRIRSGEPDLIYPGEVFTTAVDKRPAVVPVPQSEPPAADPPSHIDEDPTETPDLPPDDLRADAKPEPGSANGGERHGAGARPDVEGDEPTADGDTEPQDSLPPAAPESADGPDATTAVPPTTSAPETEPRPDTATPLPREDAIGSVDDGDDGGQAARPMPLLLGAAGSTVLAVALARRWRQKRARRSARLPFDVVPPPPPDDTQPLQRELLSVGDEDAADRLDAALAHLAQGLRPRGGQRCPQPQLVQVTGDRVEVLLDQPAPLPPKGWRAEASGLIWALDEAVEFAPSEALSPMPALVTVGMGESAILVDLEAFGVVSVCGDPAAGAGLARSIVTELSARGEGSVSVEIVACEDLAALGDLDGVRIADGWDDIDVGVVAASTAALDAGRWPHAFAARAAGRLDAWTPSVVVTGGCDHPRYHQFVSEAGNSPGAGVAVVVLDAEPGAGLRIEARPDGTFQIPEWELSGTLQALSGDVADHVIDLLADVVEADNSAQPVVLGDAAPLAQAPDARPDQRASDDGATAALGDRLSGLDRGGYIDPDYDVLVRVCGDVGVEGGKQALAPVATAVTAFVALEGASSLDKVRDVVWGKPDVARQTLRNVTSAIRRSLGSAVVYEDGRLGPGDGLMTDVELIRRRADYAGHQSAPPERAETLRGALDWVTGRVFTPPPRWTHFWAWAEVEHPSWISHVDSLVGTVACDLARLYLDELSDSTGACWAARQGLTAVGPREELTLLLVAGYEAAGDEAAARDALRAYERAMEELGEFEHSDEMLAALERYHPRMRWKSAAS